MLLLLVRQLALMIESKCLTISIYIHSSLIASKLYKRLRTYFMQCIKYFSFIYSRRSTRYSDIRKSLRSQISRAATYCTLCPQIIYHRALPDIDRVASVSFSFRRANVLTTIYQTESATVRDITEQYRSIRHHLHVDPAFQFTKQLWGP